MIEHLTPKQLTKALDKAREAYNKHSTNSREGQNASDEIDRIYAEFRRRCLAIPGLTEKKTA